MSRRRSRRRYSRFVMLDKRLLESEEWQKLSHSEMIVYIYLKRNYNGGNNGQIFLKYLELTDIFAPATISKALKGLINKEWVRKTEHGGLYRYYCLYELTGKYDDIKKA